MQQKSVHLSLLRFKSFIFSIMRMSTFIFDDRLNPPRHGGYQCCTNFWRDVLPFLEIVFSCSLLEGLCCSTFLFKILQRSSTGFKSGDILGQVIVFTFFFFRNSFVILAMCFGSLSCWNIPLLPSFWRLRVILSASILVYPQAFMVPSINVISPTPFALMQPHIITLPPLCFTVGTMHSLW